jgi:hypothetical protein
VNLFVVSPTIAVSDRHLVLTLNTQATKQVLDVLAGQGRSLADEPDRVAALRPLLNPALGRPTQLMWCDAKRTFGEVYNVLLIGAQVGSHFAAKSGFPFSAADLPAASTFTRHIRRSVAVARRTDDGLYTEIRGSMPLMLSSAEAVVQMKATYSIVAPIASIYSIRQMRLMQERWEREMPEIPDLPDPEIPEPPEWH